MGKVAKPNTTENAVAEERKKRTTRSFPLGGTTDAGEQVECNLKLDIATNVVSLVFGSVAVAENGLVTRTQQELTLPAGDVVKKLYSSLI